MNFFVPHKPKVDSPEGRLGRSDAIREHGFRTGEAVRCSRCDRFLTSLKWLPPYRVELESWGKHYADLVDIANDTIVSDRFVQMFREHHLNGLSEFEPIEVFKVIHRRGRPKEPLPRYFNTTVTRSPTTVDQQASGYVWEDPSKVCPVCLFNNLKRYKRLVIKEETWNGDDIFYPRGGPVPIVSQRFKDLCEENSLRGAIFIPSENDGYDSFPWETEAQRKEAFPKGS